MVIKIIIIIIITIKATREMRKKQYTVGNGNANRSGWATGGRVARVLATGLRVETVVRAPRKT